MKLYSVAEPEAAVPVAITRLSSSSVDVDVGTWLALASYVVPVLTVFMVVLVGLALVFSVLVCLALIFSVLVCLALVLAAATSVVD